jgi:hypothetical protein
MSYSFSVKAATKAEAKQKVAEQFDVVVNGQPIHAADRDAAQAAANAFIDILGEPTEAEQVSVSVNGYVSWRGENNFVGANVSVGASLASKV